MHKAMYMLLNMCLIMVYYFLATTHVLPLANMLICDETKHLLKL